MQRLCLLRKDWTLNWKSDVTTLVIVESANSSFRIPLTFVKLYTSVLDGKNINNKWRLPIFHGFFMN